MTHNGSAKLKLCEECLGFDFVKQIHSVCCNDSTGGLVTKIYLISSIFIIISPVLSTVSCLNLQVMLLQNERCRGVNWVKDWKDYLDLFCCQPLSLTHSVKVAIWQLYITACLRSEREKKRPKK